MSDEQPRPFCPIQTTGLTGLAVAKHPHHVLTSLYSKTMRALAKMPENAVYRKNTEQIVAGRANIVASVSVESISQQPGKCNT